MPAFVTTTLRCADRRAFIRQLIRTTVVDAESNVRLERRASPESVSSLYTCGGSFQDDPLFLLLYGHLAFFLTLWESLRTIQ